MVIRPPLSVRGKIDAFTAPSMSRNSWILYKSLHGPQDKNFWIILLSGDIWLYPMDWKERLHSQGKRQLWIKQTHISLWFKSSSLKYHACFSLSPSSGLFLLYSSFFSLHHLIFPPLQVIKCGCDWSFFSICVSGRKCCSQGNGWDMYHLLSASPRT